jgi:hypothetical protein
MPRKKSPELELSQQKLIEEVDQALAFARDSMEALPQYKALACDLLAICVHRSVEHFVFALIVASVNRDATQLASAKAEVRFPKHMSVAACEYALLGGRNYFDLKGGDELARFVRRFLPAAHPFNAKALGDKKVRAAIDRLCALRNLAAHRSETAKKKAKQVLRRRRLGTAGDFLSRSAERKKLRTDAAIIAGNFGAAFDARQKSKMRESVRSASAKAAQQANPPAAAPAGAGRERVRR